MWCVYRGKVCIMMYDVKRKKYVYIKERDWDRMPPDMKMRYV